MGACVAPASHHMFDAWMRVCPAFAPLDGRPSLQELTCRAWCGGMPWQESFGPYRQLAFFVVIPTPGKRGGCSQPFLLPGQARPGPALQGWTCLRLGAFFMQLERPGATMDAPVASPCGWLIEGA